MDEVTSMLRRMLDNAISNVSNRNPLDRLIKDVGQRESLEAAIAREVRDKYMATTDMNESDGWFAGKIMCNCGRDDCEIIKTGWIFEDVSDAQDYADEMLRSIARDMLEENLKRHGFED